MKKINLNSISKFHILLFAFIATCVLQPAHCSAQAPQALNYQAVARDAAGNILANQAATVRYTFHDATTGGTILYSETQSITTNQFGLFTASVGSGTVVTGTFNTIDWALNLKYLQVELDLGSGFIDMGTAQLLSVPYALNSASTDGINGVVNYVSKFNTTKTLVSSSIFDAGGLVGIGTTTPGSILSIDDNGSGSGGLYVYKTGTAENAAFVKDNPSSSTANVFMSYNNSFGSSTLESHATGNGVAGYFVGEASSTGLQAQSNGAGTAAAIYANGSGAALTATCNNTAIAGSFTQSGTGTAGYFDAPNGGYGLLVNSGKVGIGIAAPVSLLDIENNNASISDAVRINNNMLGFGLRVSTNGYEAIDAICFYVNGTGIYGQCNTGTDAWGVGGYSANGIGGRFSTTTGTAGYFNGNISGTGTFTYTSDAKLKKNIQPMTGALNKIMQLKPSTYQYRVGEFGTMTLATGNHFGVIAQDLQKVFPELVKQEKYTGEKDKKSGAVTDEVDYLSVNYNELIPVLIKGMQEQQNTINNLKAEVESLKLQVKK